MSFQSFFMAGFECATGINSSLQPIDQLAATHHDRLLDEDYRMLGDIGLTTIREGVRWPRVDQRGRLDTSEVKKVLEAANRAGCELILDLFHYGYPTDLDFFSDEFTDRFEEYCFAVARTVAKYA